MNQREKMLKELQEYSFALTEVNLFLDSHPNDQNALDYYHQNRVAYQHALSEYESQFGPMTITGVECTNAWTWVDTPWPWEWEG